MLTNPIASDLSTMRPSALANLIDAAARNARKGFPDAALFEVGPNFRGDQPADQWTAVTALVAPHAPKHWAKAAGDPLFELKADLLALLDELGAPQLQVVQGQNAACWHPGRSARLQLGPKVVVAEFGELHPRILKAIDAEGPMLAFELSLDGDLVRPILGADKALIADARVFDVYQGPGVPDGQKSVAIEVLVQPREKTLTEGEIEGLSSRIVAAAEKATGAKLRS